MPKVYGKIERCWGEKKRQQKHIFAKTGTKRNTNAHLINKTCIRDGEKKKEKKNKGEGSEKISTQYIFHFANCSAAHTR